MEKQNSRLYLEFAAVAALAFALACTAAAQANWLAPDPAAIARFQEEESQNSHIMEVIGYLTDVYGPRLTNSPNIREAGEYAVKTLNAWGLANVREESWGPFGRGWSNELFEANEISPRHFPVIAYPKAWTPGTNGPVTADAIYAKIEREEDFSAYRGRLRGLFVLTAPMRAVDAFHPQSFPGSRLDASDDSEAGAERVADGGVDQRVAILRSSAR